MIVAVRPQVAVTFDDGPHSENTPQLLELAEALDIRLTFFVLGERIEKHASILKLIVAGGHEIANHSWSHPRFSRLSDAEIIKEITATDEKLFEVAGISTTLFRPPYGELNDRHHNLIKGYTGHSVVLWNVDSEDWKFRDAQAISERIEVEIRPQSIVLLHDTVPQSVAAMRTSFRTLRENYEMVTVSTLRQNIIGK